MNTRQFVKFLDGNVNYVIVNLIRFHENRKDEPLKTVDV